MKHHITNPNYKATKPAFNVGPSVLRARGKRTLADVICYCKMMSVMALDDVTLFLCLKDVTNMHM